MASLPGLFFATFNYVHEEALFVYINVGLLSSAVPDVSWRIGPRYFPPCVSSHRGPVPLTAVHDVSQDHSVLIPMVWLHVV